MPRKFHEICHHYDAHVLLKTTHSLPELHKLTTFAARYPRTQDTGKKIQEEGSKPVRFAHASTSNIPRNVSVVFMNSLSTLYH